MQAKLWQVIWLLLKQWRNWNKPVDFVGLITGLRRFGVEATYEHLEEIRLQEFIDSIENPTPEQVLKNKRLIEQRISEPIIDPETRKRNVELAFEILRKRVEARHPDEADKAFWEAAYKYSFHNPKQLENVDIAQLREAIYRRKKEIHIRKALELLQYPEDIVPGEEPIAVQLAPAEPQEKHILDND